MAVSFLLSLPGLPTIPQSVATRLPAIDLEAPDVPSSIDAKLQCVLRSPCRNSAAKAYKIGKSSTSTLLDA